MKHRPLCEAKRVSGSDAGFRVGLCPVLVWGLCRQWPTCPGAAPSRRVLSHGVDLTHRRNPASASPRPLGGLLADKPATVQKAVFRTSPAHPAGSCPSQQRRLGPRDPSGGGPGPPESEGPRGHRLAGHWTAATRDVAAALRTGRSTRHQAPGATGVHSARLPGWQSRESDKELTPGARRDGLSPAPVPSLPGPRVAPWTLSAEQNRGPRSGWRSSG